MKTITRNLLQPSLLSCLAVSIMFFYSLVQLFSFNGLSNHLSIIYKASTVGWLASLFTMGVMIALLPAGMLLEKFTMKKLFLLSLVINISSQFMSCISDHFLILAINRFIAGITNALIFLGTLRTIKLWAKHHITLAPGMVFTIAKMGGVYGSTIILYILLSYGWFASMLSIALIGLFSLVVTWIIYQEPEYAHKETSVLLSVKKMVTILSHPINWAWAIIISVYYLPGYVMNAMWSNMFFSQKYHLSILDASYISSLSFISALIGYFLFGILAERFRAKHGMLVFSSIGILIFYGVLAADLHVTYIEMCVISIIGNLLIGGGQTLCFGIINERFSLALSSMGNALISASINIFGLLGIPIFGIILEYNWDGTVHNGLPQYSIFALNSAISLLKYTFFVTILLCVSMYIHNRHILRGPKLAKGI